MLLLGHCPSPNTWAATLLWTHFGLDGHYTCRCLTRDQLTSLTLTTPVYSYAYTHALTIDWTWGIRQLLERNGLLCHQVLLFPSASYYGLGNIFCTSYWILVIYGVFFICSFGDHFPIPVLLASKAISSNCRAGFPRRDKLSHFDPKCNLTHINRGFHRCQALQN